MSNAIFVPVTGWVELWAYPEPESNVLVDLLEFEHQGTWPSWLWATVVPGMWVETDETDKSKTAYFALEQGDAEMHYFWSGERENLKPSNNFIGVYHLDAPNVKSIIADAVRYRMPLVGAPREQV